MNGRYAPPQDAQELGAYEAIKTHAPMDPTVGLRPESPKRLNEGEWSTLSNNLYMLIDAAISARGPLESNLRSYRDSYDMIAGEKDWPFENASNLRLPYTASQLESLVAYICGAVVVPRLFMVTGNTPQAQESAHLVEQFYNAEFIRLRTDGRSRYQSLIDFFHLALRDGSAYMEILWNRKRTRIPTWTATPVVDPQTGQPQIGPDGQPVMQGNIDYVDVTEKDYAEWTPIPLKDFLMLPVESKNIEDALGVARVEWLYEDQLDRMIRAGYLDSDEVERALNYVPSGNNEVASDRQGYYDKDASRQLQIGIGVGTQSGKRFRNRGPIKCWRIHTRAYDMNGDEISEENVFWLHEQGQRMLGWMPYDYPGGRPFFAGMPLPRPDEALGYSLIERLAGIATEIDSEHNARQDRRAMTLFPSVSIKEGAKLLTKGYNFSPGAVNEVESNSEADPTIKFTEFKDAPVSSFQEEAMLKQYGSEYTGLSMPAIGAQSSGRRSATESKQQNQASGTRLGLISMRLRVALAQMAAFTHKLDKQYLRTPPTTLVGAQTFALSLDVLAQDYHIGVAGSTEPVDSATRRQESLAFVETMMKFPDFQQDPIKQWHLERIVFEAFNRPDSAQVLGTLDDAMKRAQAMQQKAQQAEAEQKEMNQKLVAQGKTPPTPHTQPRR